MRMLITLIAITLQGCTFGLRQETHIVYASIASEPENVQGVIRIATNKPIPVTVSDGDKSYKVTLDLGGYYVVSAADLSTMVDGLSQ